MFYCCKCIIQAVDARLIICCNTLNKNLRLMVSVWPVSCHPYYSFPSVCLSISASMAEDAALTGAWFDGVSAPPTDESKSGNRILFPREGAVTPTGSDLYEQLSVNNPAVQHWKQSGHLPFGTNSIPSHRTRKTWDFRGT